MLGLILGAILVGLVVGALARLALPGKDPMSIPMTIGVGIAGSLIASVVVYLVTDGERSAGWFASLIGATLIVYLIRRSRGGGLASPGGSDKKSRDARIP